MLFTLLSLKSPPDNSGHPSSARRRYEKLIELVDLMDVLWSNTLQLDGMGRPCNVSVLFYRCGEKIPRAETKTSFKL